MSRTYQWSDIRKHGQCVERGHAFKRQPGDQDGAMLYTCKCGARALVTQLGISIDNGEPKSLEEQKAERAARKKAHADSGLRQ